MPWATCCSAPSSRTEKTTRPPPGLTPSRPALKPPASPAATPRGRSCRSSASPPQRREPLRGRPSFGSLRNAREESVKCVHRLCGREPLSPETLQNDSLEHGNHCPCDGLRV